MRTIVALFATLVLFVALVLGFALPAAAESLISDRIEAELSAQFDTDVTASVDVRGPGAMFRGEVATIVIDLGQVVAFVGDREVPISGIHIELSDVTVDVGAAFAGNLTSVEVGTGTVTADVWTAAASLLADAINAPDSPVAMLGASRGTGVIEVVVRAPDGSDVATDVRPTIVAGSIVLRVDDPGADPTSQSVADLLDGLDLGAPVLPLGIILEAVQVTPDAMPATGSLPAVVLLS